MTRTPISRSPQGTSRRASQSRSLSVSSSCFFFLTWKSYLTFSSLIRTEATVGRDAAYYEALALNRELGATQGIDGALRAHNLDALVLPAPGFVLPAPGFVTGPAGESIPSFFLSLPELQHEDNAINADWVHCTRSYRRLSYRHRPSGVLPRAYDTTLDGPWDSVPRARGAVRAVVYGDSVFGV